MKNLILTIVASCLVIPNAIRNPDSKQHNLSSFLLEKEAKDHFLLA